MNKKSTNSFIRRIFAIIFLAAMATSAIDAAVCTVTIKCNDPNNVDWNNFYYRTAIPSSESLSFSSTWTLGDDGYYTNVVKGTGTAVGAKMFVYFTPNDGYFMTSCSGDYTANPAVPVSGEIRALDGVAAEKNAGFTNISYSLTVNVYPRQTVTTNKTVNLNFVSESADANIVWNADGTDRNIDLAVGSDSYTTTYSEVKIGPNYVESSTGYLHFSNAISLSLPDAYTAKWRLKKSDSSIFASGDFVGDGLMHQLTSWNTASADLNNATFEVYEVVKNQRVAFNISNMTIHPEIVAYDNVVINPRNYEAEWHNGESYIEKLLVPGTQVVIRPYIYTAPNGDLMTSKIESIDVQYTAAATAKKRAAGATKLYPESDGSIMLLIDSNAIIVVNGKPDEPTTGVEDVVVDSAANSERRVYDLRGNLVGTNGVNDKLPSGIYIVGGRKVKI